MISVIKFHTRRFHITSKTFLRKIVPKTSLNDLEYKDINNKLCTNSTSTRQSSNIDYLGIESDEGVITVSPQKHSLPETIQTTKIKEKFYRAAYGVVRYDGDNRVEFHGQYGNKLDFSFPHDTSEDVEVCKIFQSSFNHVHNKVQSVNESKVFSINSKVKNNDCDPHLFDEKNQNINYIDQYYFSSSKIENFAPDNNNIKQVAVEELNFIDKDYFGTLSTSENLSFGEPDSLRNSLSEKEENSVSDKDHDNNAATNITIFENKETINEYLCRNALLSEETASDYSSNDPSELNDVEIFNNNFKSNDNKGIKSSDLLNTADTPFVESNDNFFENNLYNQINVEKCDVQNKSVTEPNIKYLEKNKFNKISNNAFKQKTKKQASRDDFENSRSSSEMLKNDLISKDNAQLPVTNISSDISDDLHINTVHSIAKENNFKYSRLVPEESNDDEVSTAHDFVSKLRKTQEIPNQNIQKGKGITDEQFDSKGFRILKNQVPDLSNFTRDEILNVLKQNVVYSDDDLLVLNKPYSLIIDESQTTKSPCLSMFLNVLAKELDRQTTDPKLFTVHRLDKETTGCLLLARNETMAQNLKSLFAQRKIIKKYWIITSGVPDPPEGVIDIPISEGDVSNRKRMVLHPNLPKDIPYRSHSRNGKPAITSYKVLSESGNAALVEVTPVTGIKHQIRVHFGFGLGCPILGDHKYSHLDKLVPQKLPSDMLQRLQVRQSKVRHIPMHIHAKCIVIPGYFEGRNLFVNVPLPDHMKVNLKRLKFRKKDMS